MRLKESLAIFPTPDGQKPTYWGNPIQISDFGTVGIEVCNFYGSEIPPKKFTGLKCTFRKPGVYIDLGTVRAPLHIIGKDPLMQKVNQHELLPQTFFQAKIKQGQYNKEAITAGFPSRTLGQALDNLTNSPFPTEKKDAMRLFLLLQTLQKVISLQQADTLHGDIKNKNIIVDDTSLAVQLIDPSEVTIYDFEVDLRDTLRMFSRRIAPKMKDKYYFKPGEPLPSKTEIVTQTYEFIATVKDKLKGLGYPADTLEEQNNIIIHLAADYRRIQLNACFNHALEPSLEDSQYKLLVNAMDSLVQNAPVVAFPGNKIAPQDL